MATLSELRNQAKQSGQYKGMNRGQQTRNLGGTTPVETKKIDNSSNIQKFATWATNVSKQTFNVSKEVVKKAPGYVVNTGKEIVTDASLAARSLTTDYFGGIAGNIKSYNQQKELDAKFDTIVSQYKSGQMSKDDYVKSLQQLTAGYQEIGERSSKIYSGPSPTDRASAIVDTGVTILSLGSLKPATQFGKVATKEVAKQFVDDFATTGAKGLEKLVLRSGAARDLVARNIYQGSKIAASETVEQFIAREGKKVAVDLLIKRPLFYQSNIADAKSVVAGIATGNYPQAIKSSAWIATQMLNGGPLGAFFNNVGKLRTKLNLLSYGKQSFIDTVSKQIGNGNPSQIARYLQTVKDKAPNTYKEIEETFRIAQDLNLRVSSDDVELAAKNFLQTYYDSGIEPRNITPSMLFKDMSNWYKADQAWQNAVKKGITGLDEIEASRYTPVRWDQTARNAVADTVKNAESPEQALKAIQDMADKTGNSWGNNNNLVKRIENIIKTSKSSDEAASAIKAIDAAGMTPKNLPKSVRQELAKLGYTVAEPIGGRRVPHLDPQETKRLITEFANEGDEAFEMAVQPIPALNTYARTFERLGLSPRSSNQAATRVLGEKVVANLDTTTAASIGLNAKGNVPNGGSAILNELQQYVENKRGALGLTERAAVSDIRQLSIKEIKEALPGLKLTTTQAKELSKAIMQGYLEVPLEFRGAGDRIVDALYRYNPAHKYYSRMQSAFRYTYNPFFRVQEKAETAILSRVQANNLIWGQPRQVLNNTVKKLDEARIFSSSLYGEAAQDQIIGRISANIDMGQKRDLAGLALDIAKKRGMTIDDLIINHPEDLDDALRIVVQYPRKGLLASPLARTLNVAFFPMRYNAKVTMLAAKALAQQPPYIQKATLHSLFQFGDWLQSDEGIKWQAEHQDAIRVLSWLTPINSIQYTMNLLLNKPDSISDVGQLGGLPLGVITQILDSQGVISLNTPYVDKKTGEQIPKYIPQTVKARAATALTDLLGSTFTYPGRTLGLPGKGESIRAFVKNFIATEGEDFEKRLDETRLTELDRKFIRVLKGDLSDEAIDALYASPAPGQFNGPTLPPLVLPFKDATPLPQRRTGLPTKAELKAAKSSTKKTKKIAQPIQ